MRDQSKTSPRPISPDSRSATSSPGSAAGATLSGSPVGRTTGRSGPDPVRASLSARQAAEKGLLTSGTYGPRSSTSSASASLQSSLGSRLVRLLDGRGSQLYAMTWKYLAMPSGPPLFALRASVRRTSENGSIGRHGSLTSLNLQAQTTGWPSPNAMPPNRGGLQANPENARKRREQGHQLNLDDAVCLASWPTPTVRDHKDGASEGTAPINALLGRAVWTVRGPTLTGSVATIQTVRDGAQLNPAHSRWLMGFPPEWDSCGAMAMLSFPKSRRRSSKP